MKDAREWFASERELVFESITAITQDWVTSAAFTEHKVVVTNDARNAF
jgi:hypothetical protein